MQQNPDLNMTNWANSNGISNGGVDNFNTITSLMRNWFFQMSRPQLPILRKIIEHEWNLGKDFLRIAEGWSRANHVLSCAQVESERTLDVLNIMRAGTGPITAQVPLPLWSFVS